MSFLELLMGHKSHSECLALKEIELQLLLLKNLQ